MNQEVIEFIDAVKEPWQQQLCTLLREIVISAIPDVQERIQYKKPHFLKNGKYAAVISTSKDAVSFTLFNTANMTLPEGFEGPPERKTLKLKKGQEADRDLLSTLVSRAASELG